MPRVVRFAPIKDVSFLSSPQRGLRVTHIQQQWNYFLCTLILIVVCREWKAGAPPITVSGREKSSTLPLTTGLG